MDTKSQNVLMKVDKPKLCLPNKQNYILYHFQLFFSEIMGQ